MKTRKPAWWQLYLLVPVMFGLFVLETARPLPGISDQIVDGGLVVLFFGLVFAWVHLNGGLLEHYYMQQDGTCDFKITVYTPENVEQPSQANMRRASRVPDSVWQNVGTVEKERWSRN